MQDYVAGFLFDHIGKQVVLVKKKRPAWQEGLLNGVGGKIEEGETPYDAMIREFCEETGYAVGGWVRFCVLSGYDFKVYFYFLHDDLSALELATQSDHDESIELHFVDELNDGFPHHDCIPNIHWLIPMALERDRGNPYEVTQD